MTQDALLRWIGSARRAWWWLVVPVLVGASAGAVLAIRSDDVRYRATAVTYAQGQLPSTSASGSQQQEDPEPFLRSQAQLARSSETLGRVVTALGSGSVDGLRASVSVRVDGDAKTLAISAVDDSPAGAVATANAVADALSDMGLEELSTRLRVRADELQRQVDRMAATVEDLNAELQRAREAGEDTTTLQARRSTASSQYSSLVTSQQELLNAIALQRAPLAMLEPAQSARTIGTASPVLRGLIGALVGLLVGVGLLRLRQFLDDTVRWVDQAESLVEAPLLAELPEEKIDRPGTLPVLEHPTGGLAESFRGLRTALKFVGQGSELRSVAVVSSQPGDGKTLTAANLAVSYAQAGVKVVLVSGDLRNPALDQLFDSAGDRGFADILAKPANLDGSVPDVEAAEVLDALQYTAVRNLRILPAGTVPEQPSELLAGKRAGQVVQVLHSVAEMVIVDSPPLVVADPEILGGMVDGLLLVVSVNRTRVRRLRRAVSRLRGTRLRLVGLVVNRTNPGAGYYGQYAYGGYRAYGVQADRSGAGRRGRGSGRRSPRVASAAPAAAPTVVADPVDEVAGQTEVR